MMCLSVRCYCLASCLLSSAGSPPKAHGGGATFNLSNAQYITSVLSVNLPIFLSSAYACLTATHVLQRFHVIFDMIFSAFQHISNENTHFSSTNVDGAASVNGGATGPHGSSPSTTRLQALHFVMRSNPEPPSHQQSTVGIVWQRLVWETAWAKLSMLTWRRPGTELGIRPQKTKPRMDCR